MEVEHDTKQPVHRIGQKRTHGPEAGEKASKKLKKATQLQQNKAAGNERQLFITRHVTCDQTKVLVNPQGHQSSQETNAQLLVVLGELFKRQINTPKQSIAALKQLVFEEANKLTRRSVKFLQKLWKHFESTKQVLQPTEREKHLKGAMTSTMAVWATGFIDEQALHGVVVTSTTLQAKLKVLFQVELSPKQICRGLKRAGYVCGRLQTAGKWKPPADRSERVRKFALELDAAIKAKHKIVFLDESFCHTRHHANFGWHKKLASGSSKVHTGSGKGQRLIILHAITEDGLVTTLGNAAKPIPVAEFQSGKILSAMMVYKAGKAKGDYHKSMDGDMFLKWLDDQLLPTANALWGQDQKIALVMDNAPYHRIRGPDYVDPAIMNKKQLADVLVNFGITSVSGFRLNHATDQVEEETFLQATFERRANKVKGEGGGPSSDELKARLQRYINEQRPELQHGQVQKLLGRLGHLVIFTPPYMPQLQPVELVWARVKQHVAKRFVHNKTPTMLAQSTHQRLHGHHPGVLQENYRSYFERAQRSHRC